MAARTVVKAISRTSVAIAVLWRQLFASDGLVNSFLAQFGIEGPSWISHPNYALWTLIVLAVWQFGSPMIIFLAGLRQIPTDMYEAASLDGASKFRQFYKITLPLLTPVIFFNAVVQTIEAFRQGDNTRIVIEPKGTWEHNAYQSDTQFVVEVKPVTADTRTTQRAQYTGEKLSLNFQNVEVRAVLNVIADFTDLNIITSDSVGGNITLRLKDVPWDQAMDIILQTRGLDSRRNGNVIWIAPRDELATREKLLRCTAQLLEKSSYRELSVIEVARVGIGSPFEQHLDQIESFQLIRMIGAQTGAVTRSHIRRRVMHVDSEIERAIVGIGAEVDKRPRKIESVIDDGDDERSDVVAVGQTQIRTALRQQACHRVVSVAHGVHERREPAGGMIGVLPRFKRRDARLPVGIRLRVEQRPDDLGVPLSSRPHQRRLLLIRRGVHVTASLDQQSHGVGASAREVLDRDLALLRVFDDVSRDFGNGGRDHRQVAARKANEGGQRTTLLPREHDIGR